MRTKGLWLSMDEVVEVESVTEGMPYERYRSPMFKVKRQDGSAAEVERRDILLTEEEQLIDELATILYSSKNPARHERYAAIMRQLIMQGIPYVSQLQRRKPQQEALNLYDVS
ncbi:hypothetical protein XYCOK13_24090 [Xylanibacillus composti]|uniref:Uncharacterized protein n=1 Tax=Xylanibacillus composti TaxID=1572762 RepID=A0A8J4M285_9BACL|nr:hypothetical protein [Xylanibacillus composti]GIQ69585.1 hypothetical protein XYCOK13_24090 [Xylanibacillus composti]